MGSTGRISLRILLILGSFLAVLAIGYSLRSGRPWQPPPGAPEPHGPGAEEFSPGTALPEVPEADPDSAVPGGGTGAGKAREKSPSAAPLPPSEATAPAADEGPALPPSASEGPAGPGVPGSVAGPPAAGEKHPIPTTAPPATHLPATDGPGEEEEAGGPSNDGTPPQGTSIFTSQGAGLSSPAGSPATGEAPPVRRSSSSGGGGSPAGDSGGPPRTAHVRMVPDMTEVTVGSRLSLRVLISEAADVGSVPFHLFYDPSVLKFEGGEEGEFLRGDGRQTAFFAAPTSGGNEVVIGLSRLGRGDGRHGGGELCTLRFTVVGPGDARLQFDRAKVRTSANLPVPAVFEPVTILAR